MAARRFDPADVRIPGTSLQGWRAIAVGALAFYILVFIAINNRRLEVNFLFFRVRSNELLALVVLAGLSFAAGFVLGSRRSQGGPPVLQPPGIQAPRDPAPVDQAPGTPPDPGAAAPEDTSAQTRAP